MNDIHRVYLSLGSNIHPETNLLEAINHLREVGNVAAWSSAWESAPIGARGPNFLNACVLYLTPRDPYQLKNKVFRPLENSLGRTRSKDKSAPRTIDIDIVMLDGKPANIDRRNHAYVVLPMAELLPEFEHPIANERLTAVAQTLSRQTWIEQRPYILIKKL